VCAGPVGAAGCRMSPAGRGRAGRPGVVAPGGRPALSHRAGDVPGLRVVDTDCYPDWEAVYRDNVARVYGLMFTKVGNRPDAEDLTAEVFLAALRPLRLSATSAEVRAYLLATARTVLAAHWRRTLGREITTIAEDAAPPGPLDGGGDDDHGGDDDGRSEVAARVMRVLDALPANYRAILRLRFLEAYSLREAAAALGVSVGNAKVLQHRALRRAAQLDGEVRRG
jgi:RNA polymerase sigma factor (sigma-70 family)